MLHKEILSFLESIDLAQQSASIPSSCSEIEYSLMLTGFQYLYHFGLLNAESLNACLNVTQKNGFTIFKAFQKLNDHKIKINGNELNTILKLKQSEIIMLESIMDDLSKAKLLDEKSFSDLFQRVTAKLPIGTELKMEKISRNKNIEGSKSKLIIDNKVELFPDPDQKNQKSGIQGIVKNVYSSPTDEKPTFIIKKKIHKHSSDEKDLRKEIKYNRLLGRQVFFYKKYFLNKPGSRIVSDWVSGKSFHRISSSELMQQTIENKIRCFIFVLSELNILHNHLRGHNDISNDNVLIDFANASMRLIDFGYSKKGLSVITNDIGDLGIIFSKFFPELFRETIYNFKNIIVVHKQKLTCIEQAIVDLVMSMVNEQPNLRCTSKDALEYCKALIQNIPNLNDEKLESIKNSTINHANRTVEDILRGRRLKITGIDNLDYDITLLFFEILNYLQKKSKQGVEVVGWKFLQSTTFSEKEKDFSKLLDELAKNIIENNPSSYKKIIVEHKNQFPDSKKYAKLLEKISMSENIKIVMSVCHFIAALGNAIDKHQVPPEYQKLINNIWNNSPNVLKLYDQLKIENELLFEHLQEFQIQTHLQYK